VYAGEGYRRIMATWLGKRVSGVAPSEQIFFLRTVFPGRVPWAVEWLRRWRVHTATALRHFFAGQVVLSFGTDFLHTDEATKRTGLRRPQPVEPCRGITRGGITEMSRAAGEGVG
jgi:hypothetical protein